MVITPEISTSPSATVSPSCTAASPAMGSTWVISPSVSATMS